MMRQSVRALVAAVLFLMMMASARGHLGAAGQLRPEGPKATATAGQLIISEFRLRGFNGAEDEFIEIYNASGADHTVAAASGTGYAIVASDGAIRCSLSNGLVVPNRGHFLCTNSDGYSLGGYPAGAGGPATGDVTYNIDIPDNVGIALFNNNSGGGSFSLANRLDAAGPTSEANTTYREGAGYPALTVISSESSFLRRPAGGCTGSLSGNCPSALLMQTTPPIGPTALVDTNSNANDFIFVDSQVVFAGAGQRLGVPGPENSSSPISRDGTAEVTSARLDTCVAPLAAPNKVRDLTSDPANFSTLGTLDIRRVWTNRSGGSLIRLRFRIVDITTFPSDSGIADLRARTSTNTNVTVDRSPCGTGTSSISVKGTTLEQPPSQTVNGGGYNASLSVTSVSVGTPLANGASIDVRFLLGVQQAGIGRFCVVPETVPSTAVEPFCLIGDTEVNILGRVGDFDYDQASDLPLYNAATGQWKVLRSAGGFVNSTTISWGGAGYRPVPGDYDGDGRVDAALYQESTGVWAVLTSSSNYTRAFSVAWGGYGYLAVPGDYDGDGISDLAVYQPTTGFWYTLTSTSAYTSNTARSWGGPGYTPIGGQDFDGDKKADLAIYQATTASLYVLKSTTGFTTVLAVPGGGAGWSLVPGDYDGDGLADVGFHERGTGTWDTRVSSASYLSGPTRALGGPGTVPVTGDFDGDNKGDFAAYQAATNKWFISKSSTAYTGPPTQVTFGAAADAPVSSAVMPVTSRDIHAGDFDGDFRNDMTVYNPTSGVWSILNSSTGFTGASSISWGGTGYSAAPGDYDGDGKADLGLYHSASGTWYVLLSAANFTTSLIRTVGGAGEIAVPGDYDGDGKADLVVYNTTTGLWHGVKSSTAYATTISVTWGGTGYTAAPGDFDGDGMLDLAIYQASTGNWSILRSNSGYTLTVNRNFGGAGYAPAQGDYDGDGFTDFGVYQASTGVWTMLKSSAGNLIGFTVSYGGAGYSPVAGDWDGDGRADVGVYSTAGLWSILLSSGNFTTSVGKSWGGAGYAPIPVFQ